MASATKSAWERALAALSRRALSVREVRLRLARAGHGDDEVEDTVRRLVELKLVDDESVAYNHARSRAREGRKGPAKVRGELAARGIARRLADEALSAAFEGEELAQAAGRALERMARGMPRPIPEAERPRLAARLMRAGFPAGIVRRLLASAAVDVGEDLEFDGVFDDAEE